MFFTKKRPGWLGAIVGGTAGEVQAAAHEKRASGISRQGIFEECIGKKRPGWLGAIVGGTAGEVQAAAHEKRASGISRHS